MDHFEVATHKMYLLTSKFFELELDVDMNEMEEPRDSTFDIRGKAVYFGKTELFRATSLFMNFKMP